LGAVTERLAVSYMESQDTGTLLLFKTLSAIETHKNRFILGAAAVVLVVLVILFFSWEKDNKEINAGQALSQMGVTVQTGMTPAKVAGDYLKIAEDYAGTQAAQRAQLLGASALFAGGDYAGAQAQFQKFIDAYPGSSQLATAALGVASAEEAQGLASAGDAYQSVVDTYHDPASAISAQFALARIDEQHAKLTEAIRLYEQIARSVQGTTLGHQASVKVAELSAQLSANNNAAAALASKLNALVPGKATVLPAK